MEQPFRFKCWKAFDEGRQTELKEFYPSEFDLLGGNWSRANALEVYLGICC